MSGGKRQGDKPGAKRPVPKVDVRSSAKQPRDIREQDGFQPSLEDCAEIWSMARVAWASVEKLDQAVGGSDVLAAAMQEIHGIQLRVMKPLAELGVFEPIGAEEERFLINPRRGSALRRSWVLPSTKESAR